VYCMILSIAEKSRVSRQSSAFLCPLMPLRNYIHNKRTLHVNRYRILIHPGQSWMLKMCKCGSTDLSVTNLTR
jgi:hypothetical protein